MNNPVLCGSTRSTPGPGFAHGRAAGRGWNGWWRTWAASTRRRRVAVEVGC